MKFMNFLLIFSLFIVGIYAVSSDLELPTLSTTTGIPVVTEPAKPKPKTTKTTTTPTTTEKSTPSTTVSSTSSTSTTPTTSSIPSTISTTESTPTTSTVNPITTTHGPPDEPEARNWTLTNGNNTCILLKFATQLNVSYPTIDNKTNYILYNIPSNTYSNVSGSCGNDTSDQSIHIEWEDDSVFNTLNMTFKLDQHTKEYSLHKVAFGLKQALLPNAKNESEFKFYHVGNLFVTQQDRSYYCNRPQIVNLTSTENSTNVVGTVIFSKTLVEAYHKGENKWSSSIDCDAINTPDIVPIAVGIALMALVVIVLIAYIVGRRRQQARGYVSM